MKINWKRFFGFVLGSVFSGFILVIMNCLGFGMKAGMDVLLGGTNLLVISSTRAQWLENFFWLHFAIMGILLYMYNLLVRRKSEIVHIIWPTEGLFQIFAYFKVFCGLLLMEIAAYLFQFVGNAIYVAVTNWADRVSVENTISVRYLFQKIDFILLMCEAFVASQFIAFFDRKRRRKLAEQKREERQEKQRMERERKEEKFHQKNRKLYIATDFASDEEKKKGTL